MVRSTLIRGWLLVLAVGAVAASVQAEPRPSKPAAKPGSAAVVKVPLRLEPRAIDVLKAASARLAAARTMRFTAVVTYENPTLLGPPLAYTTRSSVTLQRPDKLRVITSADGPPSEFYYDGKVMMALAPNENLVAVAEAPPTIDGALKAAFDSAAIYFPFTDLVVADPYADIAPGLKHAFYIGQSTVVGDTTTDMIAYVDDHVFVQAWIGADDKLPRRLRAVYLDDPERLRHQLDLSDWQLDAEIPADAFGSPKAATATRIGFARPDPQLPPGLSRPPGKPAAKRPAR